MIIVNNNKKKAVLQQEGKNQNLVMSGSVLNTNPYIKALSYLGLYFNLK